MKCNFFELAAHCYIDSFSILACFVVKEVVFSTHKGGRLPSKINGVVAILEEHTVVLLFYLDRFVEKVIDL